MNNIFDVQSRVVVVIGALGLLDKQLTLTLLNQGTRVVALDLKVDHVDEVYGEYSRHENILFLGADATDRASLEEALSQTEARW